MIHTGEPLETILDRRKEHFRTSVDEETKMSSLDFEDDSGQPVLKTYHRTYYRGNKTTL